MPKSIPRLSGISFFGHMQNNNTIHAQHSKEEVLSILSLAKASAISFADLFCITSRKYAFTQILTIAFIP